MKHASVQRGVQTTGNHSRKVGAAPALGRVPKMPGYGRRGSRRRRNHDDDYLTQRQRQRSLQVLVWSIGIALISVTVLGAAFTFWLYPRLHGKGDNGQAQRVAADRRAKVASRFKSPSREEALSLVKSALALRDAGQVADLIRPGPMSAEEVVSYLDGMKARDGQIANYEWLSSIDKNGLSLEGVRVFFGAGATARERLAILTPDAKGVWKLDFAAFARWVKPSWKTLLEQDSGSAEVRVNASKDTYFNGPFKDESQWAAYKLVSPDTEEILVGYCRIGSPQYRAMELLWQRGETALARVTLEISRPLASAGAERWQFEITRVLAEDWVLTDKPLDDGL